jgi:hypothetical protein
MLTSCPAVRMPSNTAMSVSRWSIGLQPSDSHARAAPVSPVHAAQAADEERAVVPGQPPVDVSVEQPWPRRPHLPQVAGRDAELLRDPAVAHLSGPVRPGGHGHPVLAQDRDGPVQHQ